MNLAKKIIKSYVTDSELTNGSQQPDDKIEFYIMKLLFFATKIEKVNLSIIPEIKSILDSYSPNTFSTKFYTLQNMVNTVCKFEKGFEELKLYLDEFIQQRRKLLPFNSLSRDNDEKK